MTLRGSPARAITRRRAITTAATAAAMPWLGWRVGRGEEPGSKDISSPATDPLGPEDPAHVGKALVAITLDLEMSRNFPQWDDTHWDYEKGNLNEPTKRYTTKASQLIAEHGGRLHCFVVGRVLEQANVDWLQAIAQAGHPLGNHTYDHVNVRAETNEAIQFRFQRSPWLIEGRTPEEVIRENIRLTYVALKERLQVEAAGFRTPGGFNDGLHTRPDVQAMLLELGFPWVSSVYPPHKLQPPETRPDKEVMDSIVAAQALSQPTVYPSGLIEVPMSAPSDITAFRGGRWHLDDFLHALDLALDWVIEQRAVFDFLGHPSCLYVVDPQMKAIELICRKVNEAGDAAAVVDLHALARRGAALNESTQT